MTTEQHKWLWKALGLRCVQNLEKHGFGAIYAESRAEARSRIMDMISGYETFGFAGSMTTRSLDIIEELRSRGKTVYDHWESGLSEAELLDYRLKQGRCDCFLTSVNAVSATGEIVNVDACGNRTNAMTFGPKKVIVVAGMNKIRSDLDGALRRVREIAAPMRAKSLGMETPCAVTGICNDCNTPQRICCVTNILHRRPVMTDISVVLVGEALGF